MAAGVGILGAAASELLNAGCFLVVAAAFELLKAMLPSALSAAAFCCELALVGSFEILVAAAAAFQAFVEFCKAQRPHFALQAEASPRVHVGGLQSSRRKCR